MSGTCIFIFEHIWAIFTICIKLKIINPVGGINQGDDSVSFLKESIEYINKNQDNGNHRNSVKKARNSEILPYEVTDDAEKRKITKYFKLKML